MTNRLLFQDMSPASAHWGALTLQYAANLDSVLTLADQMLPLLQQVEEQELLESGASSYGLLGLEGASKLMSFAAAFKRGEIREEDATPDDLEDIQQSAGQLQAFYALLEQRHPDLPSGLTPEGIARLLITEEGQAGLAELLSTVGLEPSRPSSAALRRVWDVRFPVNRGQMLLNTSLINLITLFESMQGEVLRTYYGTYPGAVPGDDLRFSFKELKAHGSFEQALSAMIDHEIDGFMRRSLDDWRTFYKRAIKFDLSKGSVPWTEFVELYQRRNVVVHNNSRASRQYLNNVSPAQRNGVEINMPLAVTPEYLHRAVETLLAFGLRLINSMWSKTDTGGSELRIALMDTATLRLLNDQRWRAVQLFLQDFLEEEEHFGSADRLNVQISLWLARKQLGGLDSVRAELEAFDHAVAGERFSAQVYALLEDMEKFMAVYPASGIIPDEVMALPVYSSLRGLPGFAEALGLNAEIVTVTTGSTHPSESETTEVTI